MVTARSTDGSGGSAVVDGDSVEVSDRAAGHPVDNAPFTRRSVAFDVRSVPMRGSSVSARLRGVAGGSGIDHSRIGSADVASRTALVHLRTATLHLCSAAGGLRTAIVATGNVPVNGGTALFIGCSVVVEQCTAPVSDGGAGR